MGRIFEVRKHAMFARWNRMAKQFTRIAKDIAMSVHAGGPDPASNPTLRRVLQNARAVNMPKDKTEAAIRRASGKEAANYQEILYEGYAPHGVALLVELSTDNRNRTASEIRSLVTKGGGSIATAGSVSRLFQRKGQIIVSREAAGEDQLMELALEAGAEDFKADENGYEILTAPVDFERVHKQIEAKGIKCEAAEITSLPVLTVPPADPAALAAVSKLIEALEEHDDVKEVFSNAGFPEA